MGARLAVIADIHYASVSLDECTGRRRAIGDLLLLRAVHRLNRFIQPDLTVLMGDLIDRGSRPDAAAELRRIKEITDLLESPVIALPGNHDGDVDEFCRVFGRPPEWMDVAGVRFVPFIDPEEPHYNSHRTPNDLRRMRVAGSGFDGPLVSLQHVPLVPPGLSACPYGLLNVDEALAAMREGGYVAAISGHYHTGDDLTARGEGPYVIAPALCEQPFEFLEMEIAASDVRVRRHALEMPTQAELFDLHVHTPFAYCSQNMDIPMAVALAGEMGLAGMSFAEHSGQLYFENQVYWSGQWMAAGLEFPTGRIDRADDYFRQAVEHSPPARVGLEIDCDASGNPLVCSEDMARAQVRVGALHFLQHRTDPEAAAAEVLARLDRFLGSGIDILAHPMREFARAKLEPPARMVPELVRLLKKHGVAAEINFHTNEPTRGLVAMCLESGVKLSLGSDSHNLYEVGEFRPHLDLLEECGVGEADLSRVLVDPDGLGRAT